MYATRSDGGFTYGHSIDYQCLQGFRANSTDSTSIKGFTRECTENGTWSAGNECIGECKYVNHYVIIGSVKCYNIDSND